LLIDSFGDGISEFSDFFVGRNGSGDIGHAIGVSKLMGENLYFELADVFNLLNDAGLDIAAFAIV
jgi:hypothetical protein